MTQNFLINKNSTLPVLRMEATCSGQPGASALYAALQGAEVTFSMENIATGVKKIANAPAFVTAGGAGTCAEECVIEYRWRPRDTREAGVYRGQFRIRFSDKLSMDGAVFPVGDLVVPITEELLITVCDGSIRV